jgi:hypothetical protein
MRLKRFKLPIEDHDLPESTLALVGRRFGRASIKQALARAIRASLWSQALMGALFGHPVEVVLDPLAS